MVDYPGKVSAVFFTSGCNFSCGYCHNKPLIDRSKKGLSFRQLHDAILKFKSRDWVTGVVITGGEPTIWKNLPDLVQFCKSYGLSVKLDTNGSNPDLLESLMPVLDYVAMDVKGAPSQYLSLAKFDNLSPIEKSLRLLIAGKLPYEFRTTVIADFHTDGDLRAMAEWVRGAKRFVFQPFIPQHDLPDESLRNNPRTSSSTLMEAARILRKTVDEVIVRGA